MAAACLTPTASSVLLNRTATSAAAVPPKQFLSFSPMSTRMSLSSPHSSLIPIVLLSATRKPRLTALLAVADEAQVGAEEIETADQSGANVSSGQSEVRVRPCELYVCNIPRTCGVDELTVMFKPYGNVLSVEVPKNPETGESRGCAYVTMVSGKAAKDAITGLDKSVVDGREMRVNFSVSMSSKRRNSEALNTTPMRTIIYESPYKLYVGNLAWAVTPEELYKLFSEYGTMVSTRIVHDSKAGKKRSYAFISFATPGEREAALLANGTELHGRILVTRLVAGKVENENELTSSVTSS